MAQRSVQCFGETKFFRRCPQHVVIDVHEQFGWCWEHATEREPRLREAALQRERGEDPLIWRPLGLAPPVDVYEPTLLEFGGAGRNRAGGAPPTVPSTKLASIASSAQNVHDSNVQLPVQHAVLKLRAWAKKHRVRVDAALHNTLLEYLAEKHRLREQLERPTPSAPPADDVLEPPPTLLPVASAPPVPAQPVLISFISNACSLLNSVLPSWMLMRRPAPATTTNPPRRPPVLLSRQEMEAIDQIQHCYEFSGDIRMFGGITYKELASYVWARVHCADNTASCDTLVQRFLEEVYESRGKCLNGNMTRLMNVFAGVDEAMSVQSVSSVVPREQVQQKIAALAADESKSLAVAAAEAKGWLRKGEVPW